MQKLLKCKGTYGIVLTITLWLLFCYALAKAGDGYDVGCKRGDALKPPTCSGTIAVLTYTDNDDNGIYSRTVDGPKANSWFAYGIADKCDPRNIYFSATLKTQDDGVFIFPESVGCMMFSTEGPMAITSTHYVAVANVPIGQVSWVYLPHKSKLILEGAPSQPDPTALQDEREPVRVFTERVYVTSIVLGASPSGAHQGIP